MCFQKCTQLWSILEVYELRLQNVNASLQTNTRQQGCRMLASWKRNQPNAFHSDYQNHEDACSTRLHNASHLKERLLKGSNIFPEATSSGSCIQ